MKTIQDTEKGTVGGQRNLTRLARTHQDYWKTRLRRRTFKRADGTVGEIPEWQVRIRYQLREEWFNLATSNQAVAAVKARDLYLCLIAGGWDAAMATYKPGKEPRDEICTVGEFLTSIRGRIDFSAKTFHGYVLKLRKIVADISEVEKNLKPAALRQKYDYIGGGRLEWLKKVEAAKLSILTPSSLTSWRNRYVAAHDADPLRRKSAERSASSTLRCVRALFSGAFKLDLPVKLPENPFTGFKIKDPGCSRYRSEVSAEWLLQCAAEELRFAHPQQFLALTLCLWGGLRRKEADLLTWEQVDLERGHIFIRHTQHFSPKTEESERTIDLPPAAVQTLAEFQTSDQETFVLSGNEPHLTATYAYYRAEVTWNGLSAWLKSKGVRDKKPIHALRKESGSLIACRYGIEGARQHLGHRSITTTSQHYVAKKTRLEVVLTSEPAKATG